MSIAFCKIFHMRETNSLLVSLYKRESASAVLLINSIEKLTVHQSSCL